MSAIHETAYPRIKPYLSHDELQALFMPTPDELRLLNMHTKKTLLVTRLGFMALLKCYQYLGRPVKLTTLDPTIKKYIAEKIEIDPMVDLKDYSKLTRTRHLKIIRTYLNINADKKERRKIVKMAALNAATTKENLADIINIVIEELIKSKFELPPFQQLVRLAQAARTVVNNKNYSEILEQLSLEQKQIIDHLFSQEETFMPNELTQPQFKIQPLTWLLLKQEAKKPTLNNIKEYIRYVNQLKALRQQLPVNMSFIVPARLEQLRDEAMVADKDDMLRMRPLKRYALATLFIHLKTASSIDDLVQVFISWVRQIENKGREALEAYRCEHAHETDAIILAFYQTLLAIKNSKTEQEKINAIEKTLGSEIEDLIAQCQEYLGLIGDKHIGWMLKPYQNKRSIIFQLLENLTVFSSSNDKSVENALKFVMHYRHSHREWIALSSSDLQPDLSLLSESWFKVVTGLNKGATVKKINRHYYEMAVMTVLMGDLNCSDAYVEGAFIYDDPNRQFVTWEEFEMEVDPYCAVTKLEKKPKNFVETLQTRLRQAIQKVDDHYLDNRYLVISKGIPTLKKLPSKKEHPDFEKIKKMIMEQMPLTTIVDVIIDVENWLQLSIYFKPLSGNETKITDYSSRFVATTLSYGANIGPTQTERSLLKYSRKQIAWLFNHHVTPRKLIKAIKKLINIFKLFDLPKHWGPGDSVSVDGTFWDVYKQNLLAAHHIRYGRYGGVGYYHVSDQYIALFSNFISCGVHESVYLLDGVVENDSDILPTKVHGDSWAQSEVLFGVASLLAIQIMPRIKQFKNLHYYKAANSDHYENIDELFTEKPIDWELIETHYHDMLRVVVSIHKGKVKASTVLRKLCSKSRKNRLYFAFRELGRVERTIFLLNYIHSPELRQMIQAATCKSEEFNEFIKWVSFGDGGVIGDNLQFSQEKIIKFSHLLVNMLIFHNVVHQTKAINYLKGQGIDIPVDILKGISPYWREHVNRLGTFQLDMDKSSATIEYDLKKKQKI